MKIDYYPFEMINFCHGFMKEVERTISPSLPLLSLMVLYLCMTLLVQIVLQALLDYLCICSKKWHLSYKLFSIFVLRELQC